MWSWLLYRGPLLPVLRAVKKNLVLLSLSRLRFLVSRMWSVDPCRRWLALIQESFLLLDPAPWQADPIRRHSKWPAPVSPESLSLLSARSILRCLLWYNLISCAPVKPGVLLKQAVTVCLPTPCAKAIWWWSGVLSNWIWEDAGRCMMTIEAELSLSGRGLQKCNDDFGLLEILPLSTTRLGPLGTRRFIDCDLGLWWSWDLLHARCMDRVEWVTSMRAWILVAAVQENEFDEGMLAFLYRFWYRCPGADHRDRNAAENRWNQQ